jgi:hypothetical protein
LAGRWSLAFTRQHNTANNIPERNASRGRALVCLEAGVFGR